MRILFLIFCSVCVLLGKNVLTMAVSENIGEINPQDYQDAMFAQNALYEGLVGLDKDGNIIPVLATKWRVSQNGLEYEFALRENVYFSNGEIFNADAVIKNFHSILKNRTRHSWSGLVGAIKDIKKIDDYKVLLVLKYPYSPTLNELSAVRPFRFLAPSGFPSDLDLIKHTPTPIGTGAYMKGETKIGVYDKLIKNPRYWNAKSHKLYYDEIMLRVIFEPNAKIAALKSGQIDMIYGYDEIPIELFKAMSRDKSLQSFMSKPIFTTSLVINSAPFRQSDEKKFRALGGELDEKIKQALREAIAISIDKNLLINAVYGDLQEVSNHLFAFKSDFKARDCVYDAESAKAKLKLIPPQYLKREIIFSGDNPAQKIMAEIIANQLKAVGINATISAVEPSIYRFRLLNGDFDMAFNNSWGAPYEPLSELYSMLIPSHIDFSAQAGLANIAEIHALIREIVKILPQSQKYKKQLNEILSLLEKSAVYVPLTTQRNKALARSGIKGLENMSAVSYEVPFWDLYE